MEIFMFEDWLKKSWLKPLSILIVFVILLYTSLQFFPKTEEESFVPFIICISVFAAVFLGYIIYYLFKNFYYPKAKKMQNGIMRQWKKEKLSFVIKMVRKMKHIKHYIQKECLSQKENTGLHHQILH